MLRDADPSSFSAVYVVCGYTDMCYGMDTLAAIIETRYHLPLFVPNTLFLFCGRRTSKIKGLFWMRATEIHLNILYEELLKELITSSLIHADETPFEVIRDGRSSGAKSYMWVYCTGESEKHPVILYDYRSTRKADHPKEFLRNYSGILVTDGYQVYHSLEKQKDGKRSIGSFHT